MNIEVSFIIPVFNSEKYIARCIMTLQQISMSNIEFLFINDGSTDGTTTLIEKAALTDSRIKLYNQENSGVSFARNRGIEEAKGKWVTFVDGDDLIASKVYEKLMDNFTDEIDMYVMGCVESNKYLNDFGVINDNFEVLSKSEIQSIKSKIIQQDANLILDYKKRGVYWNSVWARFYKKSIVRQFDIKFSTNMAIGEDLLFEYLYLSRIKNVLINYSVGYLYYINTMSVMHAYRENKAELILRGVKQLLCELPEEEEHIYQFGIKQYLYALQLDFCNMRNQKRYCVRKEEAISMRRNETIQKCFEKGSVFKLRKAACVLAIPAKYELFYLCNLMLKVKEMLKIKL